MDNIAGQKSGLGWAVNITVVLMVLLWLIPTVGLFVSSFRDRDQISASGWWQAPFSVDLTFRSRAGAEPAQQGDLWVYEGNLFQEDPALIETFAEGDGEIVAFGDRGVQPAAVLDLVQWGVSIVPALFCLAALPLLFAYRLDAATLKRMRQAEGAGPSRPPRPASW